MPTKITGEPDFKIDNLDIYTRVRKAKKKGKNRIWVHIRQCGQKKFRISQNLNYGRGIDICFEEATEVKSKG